MSGKILGPAAKSHVVSFRLTDDQHARLVAEAQRNGISINEHCRRTVIRDGRGKQDEKEK